MGCVGSKQGPSATRRDPSAAAGPAAQPSTSTRGAASGRTGQAATAAAGNSLANPGAAQPDDPIFTARLAATGQPKELRSGLLAAVEVTTAGATQDFYIESNLGHGSFGEVFRARHRGDSTKAVALKVMARDRIKVTSIQREFAVMEAMGMHPGIVGYYGCYKTEDKVVFVLELMNGGELFERLVHKGAYTEAEARPAFRRVARALAYLHSRGIVHRDLKPENLLLKEDSYSSEIKIADFGLSQLIRSSERLVKVCGTWAYAAPEMSDPTRPGYDTRFDSWGFGVILSVVLTGFHPFDPEGGLPVDTIKHRARNAIWSFDQPEWQSISPQARDLIAKLIVKDPSRRLSSLDMTNHPWLRDFEPLPRAVGHAAGSGAMDPDGSVVAPPFDPVLWLTRTERVRSRGAPPSTTIPPPGDPDDLLREASKFLAIPGAFGGRRDRAGDAEAAGPRATTMGAGATPSAVEFGDGRGRDGGAASGATPSAVVLGDGSGRDAVAIAVKGAESGVSSAAPPTEESRGSGGNPGTGGGGGGAAPGQRGRPPPASIVPPLTAPTTTKRSAMASRSARRQQPVGVAAGPGRPPAVGPSPAGSSAADGREVQRHSGSAAMSPAVLSGPVVELVELAPGVTVPSHLLAASKREDPTEPARRSARRLNAFQRTMRNRQRERSSRHRREQGSDAQAAPPMRAGLGVAETAARRLVRKRPSHHLFGGSIRIGPVSQRGSPTGGAGGASSGDSPRFADSSAGADTVVVMVQEGGTSRPYAFSQRLNPDGSLKALVPVLRRVASPLAGPYADARGTEDSGSMSPASPDVVAPADGTAAPQRQWPEHRRAGTASAPQHRHGCGTGSAEACVSSVSSHADGLRPPAVINAHGCGWEDEAACGASCADTQGSEEMAASMRSGAGAEDVDPEEKGTASASESLLSERALRQRLARQRPTMTVLAARGDDDLSSASCSRSEDAAGDSP